MAVCRLMHRDCNDKEVWPRAFGSEGRKPSVNEYVRRVDAEGLAPQPF
jgi:hypothetical protein